MTEDDIKKAYKAFALAERAVDSFSRECADEDEAMDAEAERQVLKLKADIAERQYFLVRHEFMAETLKDLDDDDF
jgi:hypothetical protein